MRRLWSAIDVDGARIGVVGEHDRRADEDTRLEVSGLIDERVILHLAVVAHDNPGADVGAAPHHAVLAHDSVFAHLGKMPNRAARSDTCRLSNISGINDANVGRVSHEGALSMRGGCAGTRRFRVPRSDTMGVMAEASSPAITATIRRPDVWIVIPLFNEATVISTVIADLQQTFTNIVCVDDGSTDDSAAVAEAAGARVIRHPHNLGQGAALQTGISYARAQPGAEYLVTFDADGQHRVVDAIAMLELARHDDAAIIFGSRFLDDRTKPGLAKKVVLKTAVAVTNLSTGLKLTDAHNGLRVLRVDAANAVNLKQDRMAHASEIVVQLGRSGLAWREFPVEVLYTDYSKAKGQSLLNSINILVDLIIN